MTRIYIAENKNNISKFKYRSKLLKQLYIPKHKWNAFVENYIMSNFPELIKSEYILIHIRRGDKVAGPWKETELIPTEKYLKELKTYIKKQSIKNINVFIMTDSDKVIQEFASMNDIKGINFYWDKNEIRRDGYSYKLYKYGYSDQEIIEEMMTNMKNLKLMQHAKILIGARSSFLFIAGELLNGSEGISLEDNKKYPTDL